MPQQVDALCTPSRQRPGGACEECRRRKLRCDRQHPQCGVCAAAGVACFTTATRAPRGPKRGYLKAMQARIAALEGAVNQQQADGDCVEPICIENGTEGFFTPEMENMGWKWDLPIIDTDNLLLDVGLPMPTSYGSSISSTTTGSESAISSATRALDDISSSEIGHGLTAFEDQSGFFTTNISTLMQAELDQLFFDRVDACIPILHQGLYSSWARQTTKTRQQLGLQYTMWTAAAAASAHYKGMGESLYCEARRLIREPEEGMSTPATTEIEYVQAWLLLAIHELMFINFRRGWISAGRAFRLIQLDWARYIDDSGSESAPAQWVEIEQRRRTYWMAYCLDRFMSLRSDSPPTFSEQNIIRLPAPESAFQNDIYVSTSCLADAISSRDGTPTSSFTECIVVATMAGRALSHRHLAATQPNPPHDFWDRHQLINTVMIPRMASFSLKYPSAMQEADPVLLFVSLMWRATVLTSQVTVMAERAVSAPDDNGFIVAEYARRSSLAAQEVVCMAKKLSQVNWFKVHPLTPIPLSLCYELLKSHDGLDESIGNRLSLVQKVMDDINRFNNLGRGFYNYKV
ncbi:fungal-specific transcription factor domain-containing protein [Nemania sp. NC0429]|nr:fungal-specific transcription factor domain-containing protein [Nemania sp. NC0429]